MGKITTIVSTLQAFFQLFFQNYKKSLHDMANLNKIKQLAAEREMLPGDLCDAVGISRQGLAKIMRDNSTTTGTLEKLCDVLGCSPYDLLDVKGNVSVSTNNGNVVGVGSIGGDVSKALDILHEQLNRKDEQINGLIKALQR